MQSRERSRRLVVDNCGERSECVRRSLDGARCRRSGCMLGSALAFAFGSLGSGLDCMHASSLEAEWILTGWSCWILQNASCNADNVLRKR